MVTEPAEEFRNGVRERLADGRLFAAGTASTVRRGTGRPCNVCGIDITQNTLEHEVAGPHGSYALTHEDCYLVWREESRRDQGQQARPAYDEPSS
jgi:hypothetical protein